MASSYNSGRGQNEGVASIWGDPKVPRMMWMIHLMMTTTTTTMMMMMMMMIVS
jgi:hypothetical protein